MTRLAVIYYSTTGHGTAMAQQVAKAAEEVGAKVRLRHVAELSTRHPSAKTRPGRRTTTPPKTSPPQAATTSFGPTR
jgi:NAD(P)H dehydrogenase (quinone)